jgi:hypothetical protein
MEAKAFDLENGNTFWWDAICKEMQNVRPAFDVWDKTVDEIPVGYREVCCHLILDIKWERTVVARQSLLPEVTRRKCQVN